MPNALEVIGAQVVALRYAAEALMRSADAILLTIDSLTPTTAAQTEQEPPAAETLTQSGAAEETPRPVRESGTTFRTFDGPISTHPAPSPARVVVPDPSGDLRPTSTT